MKRLLILTALCSLCLALSAQETARQARPSRPPLRTEMQTYRGKRLPSAHEPFAIVLVEAETHTIRILFNIPVDPRTVSLQTLRMNGEKLPPDTLIRFNKPGKMVECIFSRPIADNAVLSLSDVRSFDGNTLAAAEITDIHMGMRRNMRQPQKKPKQEQ